MLEIVYDYVRNVLFYYENPYFDNHIIFIENISFIITVLFIIGFIMALSIVVLAIFKFVAGWWR